VKQNGKGWLSHCFVFGLLLLALSVQAAPFVSNVAGAQRGGTKLVVITYDLAGAATVGSYRPNQWGLYDMHGNAEELCLDWLDFGDCSPQPVTNPKGGDGERLPGVPVPCRSSRGGSWAGLRGTVLFGPAHRSDDNAECPPRLPRREDDSVSLAV